MTLGEFSVNIEDSVRDLSFKRYEHMERRGCKKEPLVFNCYNSSVSSVTCYMTFDVSRTSIKHLYPGK